MSSTLLVTSSRSFTITIFLIDPLEKAVKLSKVSQPSISNTVSSAYRVSAFLFGRKI